MNTFEIKNLIDALDVKETKAFLENATNINYEDVFNYISKINDVGGVKRL